MSPDRSSGPDFLVVGAQKSGTTTMWEDLRAHPDVEMSDKESNGLLDPAVTTPEGRRRYAAAFGAHRAGALRGEVCTTYTMLPVHTGVVERATALNPGLRVLYIVREPVSRVVSHHHHDLALRLCDPDIDVAIRSHPPLLDNTRYATQIRPWIGALGRERVLVVRFEDYVADRGAGIGLIHDFLGLPQRSLADTAVHNASAGRRVAVGAWGSLSQSAAYRRLVRPLVPERVRRRLMGAVLPEGPERPAAPSAATLELIAAELSPEVQALSRLIGEPPFWDLEAVATARREHG